MAKPKKGTGRGAVKQHGPKRKLFHCYRKAVRIDLGRLGLLDKYHDFDSFTFACQARGVKVVTESMWNEFAALKTIKAKDRWLKALRK